jgi:hypothetical protein
VRQRLVGTQQRHDQQCAEPGADDDIEHWRSGIVLDIRYLYRYSLLYCLTDRCRADMDMILISLIIASSIP